MDLDELVAREAVRDLIARYTWAGDRGRSAELAALFTDDGVLDVGAHGGRWVGAATIAAELDAVAARVAEAGAAPGPVRHHVSSVVINVEQSADDSPPSTATASSYFLVITAIGPDHWGRYRDRFIRLPGTSDDPTGGGWRFAERTVRVDGHHPDSLMVRPTTAN